MNFFLPFPVRRFQDTISYSGSHFFMGSCFSEEIAARMNELKFNVIQNPNGILYDPLSISDALLTYTGEQSYSEKDLFFLNGLWHSWQHHSSCSGADKELVTKNITVNAEKAAQFLRNADFLIITLGTSYAYSLAETGQHVANCHKAPATTFCKSLLSIDQMTANLSKAFRSVRTCNPAIKIILTVSPVKHVRDGIIENVRSKARLTETAHHLAEREPMVYYFPAFEIISEELRDYRFYKNDLVHPNAMAVDYVFEKFIQSFVNAGSLETMTQIKSLLAAINHRPMFPESEAHKEFKEKQLQVIHLLEKQFPNLDFSAEKDHFA